MHKNETSYRLEMTKAKHKKLKRICLENEGVTIKSLLNDALNVVIKKFSKRTVKP